jgi:ubiquinone/menaquinone biosynthesis C-methylase UbiE
MEHQTPPRTNGLLIQWAARYDILAWLFTRGRERELRERILELAGLQQGMSVLDIGCGTGTLAIAATRHVGPMGFVHGIDASQPMIARAERKARKAGVQVAFRLAAAERLPFPDQHFDVVLSTLMLHHLPRSTRERCAFEIARVLKPGGRVLAVDFGGKQHKGLLAHFHRHGYVEVQSLLKLLEQAGLAIVGSGLVGMNDLYFVLAEVRSKR